MSPVQLLYFPMIMNANANVYIILYGICLYNILYFVVCILMHFQCRYGQLPVVEYLVEVALCDVNCTSYDGSTPVYLACR